MKRIAHAILITVMCTSCAIGGGSACLDQPACRQAGEWRVQREWQEPLRQSALRGAVWDTVPHLGLRNGDESRYDFSIPDAVKYAASANALNEYRGGAANFNFRSILSSPTSASSGTRIEKGFLGSHADIGGGFGTGDLSDVALMWMVNQAKGAGIQFKQKTIQDNEWDQIKNPVLHDKSTNLIHGAPNGGPTAISEDRDVIYTDGTVVKQRQAVSGIMAYADTVGGSVPFITYKPNPNTFDHISGTVNAKAYLQSLNAHGYGLDNVTVQ